jgi:hypothetical protein
MEVPKQIKNRIAIKPSNFASGYKSKRIVSQRHICTPMFIAALSTIAKT